MPSLKWMAAEGPPKVFPVFKQITTIGRAAANDVCLDDRALENHHAQLVFDGRDFSIGELEKSGTLHINGKKKRRSKIFHNDRLTLGEIELIFSIFDAAVFDDASRERISAHDEALTDAGPRAQLKGMHRLSEFSRRLMEIRDVTEQLDACLDAVVEVTHAQKGFIVLLKDGEPRIAAARNVTKANLPASVHQLSDSIIQRVIEARKPLIVSDASSDTVFGSSESVMNLQLSSVMCAPLVAQGELLGLIYLGNDSVVNLFQAESLELLTVFAGQASLMLQNAMILDQITTDRDRMASELSDKRFGDIIGACPSLLTVYERVDKVAGTDISVLITGETGTGKELFAREVHRRSNRASGPFIVVNCGAIPENLMESELFGHVRGAFTGAVATRSGKFQLADGGTLFLDEIGEMPLQLQVKLLRALQERVVIKVGDSKPESVDIRVLAATNRTLEDEIRKGAFREDLFYRLNVVNLHLPPLRERGDDINVLAKFLLGKYAGEYGSQVRGFTPNALVALKKYRWPGNVRQLENRIKKAVVLCDKSLVGADDLDLGEEKAGPALSLSEAREEFTRRYILEVLEENGGNRTKTAHDLGVDPRTVFRYLEREPSTT